MTDDRDTSFDLPRPIRDALHELHGAGLDVPAEIDERILFSARDGFARRMRTRMILRRTAAFGGAVAAAVAVFFGVQAMRTTSAESPAPLATGPQAVHKSAEVRAPLMPTDGDVDRNGRVDIVDALALARRVEAGDPSFRKWEDVDHDGRITRADVERVAQVAVTLPDGEFSSSTTPKGGIVQ